MRFCKKKSSDKKILDKDDVNEDGVYDAYKDVFYFNYEWWYRVLIIK